MEFKAYLDVCEEAAFTDHFSGLANRRRFESQLEIQVTRALRETHSPFCLLVIDIDHFKRVNDTYGHQAGDQVIRQVGHWLTASFDLATSLRELAEKSLVLF